MTLKIINCTFANNLGDGIRIVGDADVHMEGVRAFGNGGMGINVVADPLLTHIGMPDDVDKKALAELLEVLIGMREDQRIGAVYEAGASGRLRTKFANSAAFVANVLTIASSSAVAEIIKALGG